MIYRFRLKSLEDSTALLVPLLGHHKDYIMVFQTHQPIYKIKHIRVKAHLDDQSVSKGMHALPHIPITVISCFVLRSC
jgi:hypothetical protein